MKQIMPLNEIFALLRQGDKKGFEVLYNDYYNKMYGIAFSIVKSEGLSEDIVHNVMYKFMKMDSNLFPTKNESAWLFSVVKNEALMLLRKEKKVVSIEQIEEIGLEDKSIKEYVDLDAFHSMIESLNDKQKTVVSLKILGGYTHKEIAEMLNKPIGTIQWIYNVAIKKLRAILASLFSFIVIFFTGLISSVYVLINYKDYLPKDEFPSGDILPIVCLNVALFFMATIGLTIAFIIIYKKSDKLPTKASIKNI